MVSRDPKPEIRTIIVDDERLARRNLKDLLRERPYVHVIGEATSVETACEVIVETGPDLVFLDVRMPEGSGFELIEKLNEAPPVIFVTAYEEFAVRAFENNAVDYLLKPIDPGRLDLSLKKFLSLPRGREEAAITFTHNDRVCLNTGKNVVFLGLMDIAAVLSDKNYIRVYSVDGECYVMRSPLKEWKDRLPSDYFIDLDRSLLINKHHARLLKKKNRNGDLYLTGITSPFHLGRAGLQRFKKLMGVIEKQGCKPLS